MIPEGDSTGKGRGKLGKVTTWMPLNNEDWYLHPCTADAILLLPEYIFFINV